MIVLDANVLIALFDPNDEYHQAAEAMLVSYVDQPLAVSVLTAAEFLVHPTAHGVEPVASQRLGDLGVTIQPLRPSDAAPLAAMRVRSGLKMPDAVVAYLAQTTGGSILTFDQGLARQARRLGLAVIDWTPST